jgi:hypothetical protein
MTRRKSVALATCAALPDLDPDEQLLLEPLRSLGVDAQPAIWDDPQVDWHSFDLVVIRCTWDYTPRRIDYVAWAQSVPHILNPAAVVAWNTDKRYLRDLSSAGVPVVPTDWLQPGGTVDLPSRGSYVLKPSVGAGSVDAGLFNMSDARAVELARAHAERLLATGQTVMVQPYMERIDQEGEAALIFFGNQFSHAITKGAMLAGQTELVDGLYNREVISPRAATTAEMAVARAALAAIPGGAAGLGYARVDLVPAADGEPVVMELELTEPSLFMGHAPGSPERFARHLIERAGQT